jgi:hypothetical protein
MVGAHPTLFRGLSFDASGLAQPIEDDRPGLVERMDENFIETFLEELRSGEGRKQLATKVRNTALPDKGFKLHQPVHRTFNLAVFDAACKEFGEPRLDPARIESSGLVVRRINPVSGIREGWMKLGGEVQGWVPLPGELYDRDPDPARWKELPGPALINDRLKSIRTPPTPYEESVSLLFVAPPPICAATHRTILYGLIPVASSEIVSDKAAQPLQYGAEELGELLLPYFSATMGVSLDGIAGKTYSYRYADEIRADDGLPSYEARDEAEKKLDQFATMVRMLISVFDAFNHQGMRDALNQVWLDDGWSPGRRLGDALAEAAEVFALENPDKRFTMPLSWRAISQGQLDTILRAASGASAQRLSTIIPRQGRFELRDAYYEVRGFIRVRRDDGCPPVLLWSKPSHPFKIAPWYESGKRPPVQVALPDVTTDNVKDFLPNVAFHVPANIFDMLSINKPKAFLEGKAKRSKKKGGVDWICGFNIPLITLLAFIVLSIFLILLNIIFWWLPFIKICIPLPRRRAG